MGKKAAAMKTRKSEKVCAQAQVRSARLDWWILFAVALVAFLAFVDTTSYGFVFDDDFQVLRNPWIRNWSGLKEVFTSNVWQFKNPNMVSNYYRPFHMVMHMLGYSLSGLQPHGYHIINLALHCICTILVALIAFRLTRDNYLAGASALIFALHPIHAESIAWIAAVTDPSCAAFYFAALYFYLKDAEMPESRTALALSLISFFCAMLCKEMAFTFPLVAVFADWTLQRKFRWSRYGIMTGVFAVYAALRIHALTGFVAREAFQLDPLTRILSTLVLLARYILKLFVPHDINAFHVFNPTVSIFSSALAFAVLVLAAFGAGVWFLRYQRVAVFLFGVCFLTLVPVLNLTRLGENVFADRYLYIPSLGASILFPLAAREVWKLKPERVKWPGLQVASISLGILLVPYIYLLLNSTPMWRDELTLFTETLKRSPTAVIMAINLGAYYNNQGDYDRSQEWYQKAIDLWNKPFLKEKNNLAAAYNGMGGAYLKKRVIEKALYYFQKANEITPNSPLVLDNIGTAFLAKGDSVTALDYYQRAVVKNPRSERTYNNIAVLYLYQAKYDAAIAMAQKALSIAPHLGEAYLIIGKAYALKGMKERARQAFLTARTVDPSKAGQVGMELKMLERIRSEN
jgi:protein O-mannosyl-transferase